MMFLSLLASFLAFDPRTFAFTWKRAMIPDLDYLWKIPQVVKTLYTTSKLGDSQEYIKLLIDTLY